MKRRPECRRDYYDDSLLYCLDDGASLLEGPSSGVEPATAILSEQSPAKSPEPRPINLGFSKDRSESETAILEPTTAGVSSTSKADYWSKWLLLVPIGSIIILLGAFFAYRYITGTVQIESIAVMPFVNQSDNQDIESLSDGMTETLISSLSQPNLRVKRALLGISLQRQRNQL